mgnify:FL=1
MTKFKVAVFPRMGKKGYLFSAYTKTYNPQWDGCNEVSVNAENGTQAKKLAIAIIKNALANGADMVRVCRDS